MKTIGVVGAGAMGAGIAQVALAKGHHVVLSDSSTGAMDSARAAIASGLAREVEKGRLPKRAEIEAMERLVTPKSSGFGAYADCDLVIEAVVERLDVKQAVFQALEENVRPDCVLATNTSSLAVTAIAASCDKPERVVGLHFFNPAPVMPLVEVVPGAQTSQQVAQAVRTLADGWGKVTVMATDTPGFIVNRVARPFYSEALVMLETGVADATTIDWAMREIGGFRMGPFLLMDFIGHDVNYAVTESVWTATYYDPRYRPSVIQRRLVEAGWLGRKTGRGFFEYAPDAAPRIATEDRALGEAIVHRILCMLVNEAVDAVYLRIASPDDVDLAMTRGVNYPKGLLVWGNEIGLDRVLAEIDRLRDETGDARYRASPLLRQMVKSGRRFFE